MVSKKLLCMDFDGVIHAYNSGWQGATTVADPPVNGAFDFLQNASGKMDVCIYSSRSGEPGGIQAMQNWMERRLINYYGQIPDWYAKVKWPTSKPAASVSIDDRAITFTGEWPNVDDLVSFQPWNKKKSFDDADNLGKIYDKVVKEDG